MYEKTTGVKELSSRRAALIAGWGLLFMTLFALYPIKFIIPDIILPENAATTVDNITANRLQFRVAICCYLVVIALDVLVAWPYTFFWNLFPRTYRC